VLPPKQPHNYPRTLQTRRLFGTYGGVPKGGVTLDSQGNIYGTTSGGGGGGGTLFVLHAVSEPSTFALLMILAGTGIALARRRGRARS
jgi:hypothetical protein